MKIIITNGIASPGRNVDMGSSVQSTQLALNKKRFSDKNIFHIEVSTGVYIGVAPERKSGRISG